MRDNSRNNFTIDHTAADHTAADHTAADHTAADHTAAFTSTHAGALSSDHATVQPTVQTSTMSNNLTSNSRNVCLISSGMNEKNIRLQPWRYLHEIGLRLIQQGHRVTVLSDGLGSYPSDDIVAGLPIQRLQSIGRPRVHHSRLTNGKRSSNKALSRTIQKVDPDIILWHVGITSFLHQQISGWPDVPVVGILTSPLYKFSDLRRIGLRKIIKNRDLSAMHVAGTILPNQIVESAINSGTFKKIIVQTQTMREQLVAQNIDQSRLTVIEPGVDKEWFRSGSDSKHASPCPKIEENRQTLGYAPSNKVILYYGSPAPLRGLHTLIRAVELAHEQDDSIRLLVLSRRHADQLMGEDEELRLLLGRSDIQEYTQIVDGFLEPETLVEFVSTSDIVALPFELVPSDAPLSLLESKALGKPIVTTNLSCLPELAAGGAHYIAEPSDPVSLSQALLQAVAALPESRTETLKCCKETSLQPKTDTGIKHGAPLRSWEKVGEEWSHLIQTL